MTLDLQSPDPGKTTGEPDKTPTTRVALRLSAIFALITTSVLFVLVCPCDILWRTPKASLLLAFSLVATLAAAFVLYRMRRFAADSTPILRGVASLGIVIAVRFVELKLAIDCVAWLA
jgi:hypothetical protein